MGFVSFYSSDSRFGFMMPFLHLEEYVILYLISCLKGYSVNFVCSIASFVGVKCMSRNRS